MNDRDSNTRRKILLGLGGGLFGATQLPKTWTKPVVDSVLLPVHAATTETDSGAPEIGPDFYGDITFVRLDASNSFMQDVLSAVVQNAHAGYLATQGEMCIKVSPPAGSGAAYTAKMLINGRSFEDAVYTGSGTVGGGAANLSFHSGCEPDEGFTLDVTAVSAAGAAYIISSERIASSGTLPPGTDCPADSTCGT